MAVARWGRSTLEGTAVTTPKVRWGRGSLEGTASTVPKVRWGRGALEGTASTVLRPIGDISNVEPGTLVSITALLADGSAAASYVWRRVSGAIVSVIGTGSTVIMKAPSAMPPGTSFVIGVRGTSGGVQSAEVTTTVNVLPQTDWSRVHNGQWVGATDNLG